MALFSTSKAGAEEESPLPLCDVYAEQQSTEKTHQACIKWAE